jgi:hypothetical protein
MQRLAAAEHFSSWGELPACLRLQLSWVKAWLALACCWLSQNFVRISRVRHWHFHRRRISLRESSQDIPRFMPQ